MTTKRLNWTGRQRITRDRVAITLSREADRPTFAAEFALGDMGLPVEAYVVVEAYRQTGYMRFPFGTVGLLVPPGSTWLEEFDPPEGLLFRIKVLGTGELEGRILAEADQIRPVDPSIDEGGRQPLLPVRGESLGEEVWRLVIDDGAQPPELQINRDLGIHWKTLARDPHVLWLVYPAALREILRAVVGEDLPDPDNPDDWRNRWLRFASLLPGVGDAPLESASSDERETWITGVVRAFCRVNRLRERNHTLFAEEGQEP